MGERKETCKTCRWWFRQAEDEGNCHKSAPPFQYAYEDNWCGDWEDKDSVGPRRVVLEIVNVAEVAQALTERQARLPKPARRVRRVQA